MFWALVAMAAISGVVFYAWGYTHGKRHPVEASKPVRWVATEWAWGNDVIVSVQQSGAGRPCAHTTEWPALTVGAVPMAAQDFDEQLWALRAQAEDRAGTLNMEVEGVLDRVA